jgi:uncharacterized membrane protein YdjX (TVP38/TMEM64 family)
VNISEQIKKIDLTRFLIGIVLGTIGGFAYYYFIGCSSGSCPLTSNPYLMIIWGMFFGGTLFFKIKKTPKEE